MMQTKTTQRNINIAPSRPRRFFGFLKRHKVLSALLVLIVVYGVAVGVVQTVLWNEKRIERPRFAQAQSDLNDLYVSITKQVGAPSDHKAVQSCSYTSVEIGRGALSCDVYEYFTYKVSDQADAQSLSAQLATLTKNNAKILHYESSTWSTSGQGYVQIASDDFTTQSELECGTDYWFFTGPLIPSEFPINDVKPSSLLIELSCGGGARAEYYPVVRG